MPKQLSFSRDALEVRSPPDTGYTYQFEADELDAVFGCVDEHGFAIIKDLISPSLCKRLQEQVSQALDPEGALSQGENRTHPRCIEIAPALLELFDNEAWLRLQQRAYGTDQLTVHRSAAIIRMPGSPGMAWHWDVDDGGSPWYSPRPVLNQGQSVGVMFFYLSGCRPQHGGLCLIPHSHRPDWEPEGDFLFWKGRRLIRHRDSEKAHRGADIPGALPIVANGTDLVFFHGALYHSALPNHSDKPRLSCTCNLRAGRDPILVPWPLPPEAIALKANAPAHVAPYLEHYASVLRPDEWDKSAFRR